MLCIIGVETGDGWWLHGAGLNSYNNSQHSARLQGQGTSADTLTIACSGFLTYPSCEAEDMMHEQSYHVSPSCLFLAAALQPGHPLSRGRGCGVGGAVSVSWEGGLIAQRTTAETTHVELELETNLSQ